MPSKKAKSHSLRIEKPDNQQERLKTIGWITGYVDGEGCFAVSIFRNKTTKFGWQVFPEFVVTQGEKSKNSLGLLKKFFHCGKIFTNRRKDNHRENLYRYCVRSRADLNKIIIPFFRQNRLRTAKNNDFTLFVQIVRLLNHGEHSQKKGLHKIARLIEQMNQQKSSWFLKSSETKR